MPTPQKFRGITNLRRERLLAFAFLAVLVGAVLSFGGAEPASGFAAEAILLFLAACALWLNSPESPRFPWTGFAMLSTVLAAGWYEVRPATYPARSELLLVAAAACAFFIAARVAETAGPRRLLCGGLLALSLFEALYGLAQYVGGWQQIATYRKIVYTMTATGTYINPNHFAGLLEMALPLTFAWSLWELEQLAAAKLPDRSRDSRWPIIAAMLSGEIAPVIGFSLFGTLVLAAALLFSRSRMGMFSAFIGLGAVAAGWSAARRKLRPATSRIAVAGLITLVLAGLLAAGAWIGFAPVLARFRNTQSDLPSRVAVWRTTIVLIRTHPVWGTGPGSFEDSYTFVQTAHLDKRMDHAHNDYLEFAEEWGIPAAALLFALVGWVLVRGASEFWRGRPSEECVLLLGCCGGVIALLVHSIADFNLHIPANAFLFATILGLAWTLSEHLASRRARSS